ncbi:MAG: hypothetical protein MI919_01865 [Holophagales bacterium]|nr:hypothetical protein [Holophagales bacterium]
MNGVSPFSWASEALETATFMNAAQCRGTLRLALKKSGLDPGDLNVAQLRVVLRQVMPREHEVRGVEDAAGICAGLESELAAAELAGVGLDGAADAERARTDSALRRIFG